MITVKRLEDLLKWFNKPVNSYGKGKAKRIDDLFEEINNGDCELIISGDHIYRRVNMIRAWVNYKGLILKETKQLFRDKRRRRNRGYFHVSEKICLEDKGDSTAALKRALAKELKITSELNQENLGGCSEIKDSTSYPGIKTEYIFFDKIVFLTKEQYKEKGYVEYEESTGITTYFKWFKVDSSISPELKCKLFNLVDL